MRDIQFGLNLSFEDAHWIPGSHLHNSNELMHEAARKLPIEGKPVASICDSAEERDTCSMRWDSSSHDCVKVCVWKTLGWVIGQGKSC